MVLAKWQPRWDYGNETSLCCTASHFNKTLPFGGGYGDRIEENMAAAIAFYSAVNELATPVTAV